jgi:hypothetical protein
VARKPDIETRLDRLEDGLRALYALSPLGEAMQSDSPVTWSDQNTLPHAKRLLAIVQEINDERSH